MYIVYTVHIYMLYRSICPLVVYSTLYIEWGCQSPNPKEIHCFKWDFHVRFVWFWFMCLLQEHIPGIKWHLSVKYIIQPMSCLFVISSCLSFVSSYFSASCSAVCLSFNFSCSMCSNSCSWCCFSVCSVRTLMTYKPLVRVLLFCLWACFSNNSNPWNNK